jgi:Tol biopolymer transport system component
LPQIITPAAGRDGSWNRDGTIIFALRINSEALMQVSAAGGRPEYLIQSADEQQDFLSPHFLPDGRHFVFSVADYSNSSGTGIYLGEIGSTEKHQIVTALSNAQYLDPGFLLYIQDDNLVALPLDPESPGSAGEPMRVAGPVLTMNYPFLGFFSCAAGGLIAYVAGSGSSAMTEMVWVDRAGNEIEKLGIEGDLYNPRLSHDGRRLAVDVSDAARTHGDIWVFDLARRSSVRLTDDPVDESRPVWSADDSELFFYRVPDLYRTDPSGAGPAERIFTNSETKYTADVSPIDPYLVYMQLQNGQTDLWALNLETSETMQWTATPYHEHLARFSPDGKWLAYQSNESGQDEVYVQRFPDRRERFLVSQGGGGHPTWRQDGKELYYMSLSGQMMAVAVDLDAVEKAPIGTPQALFSPRLRRTNYDVSADGQSFLLNQRLDPESVSSLVLIQNWTADREGPNL